MANNIYIDTSKLKNAYIDENTKVKKIYLDTILVWQANSAIPIARPTSEQMNVTKSYTGGVLSNDFGMDGVEYVRGDTSGTNGGIYTAYYRPDENHIWEDTGDRAEIAVTLTIQYVWQRWNCDNVYGQGTETSTSKITVWHAVYDVYSPWWERGTGYSFSASTGNYTINGGSYGSSYNYYITIIGQPYCSIKHGGSATTPEVYEQGPGVDHMHVASTTYRLLVTKYSGYTSQTLYRHYSYHSGYSKGGTYYGNVVNTSNIYPENGRASDGYWYIKTW